jgi:hypothetical protein
MILYILFCMSSSHITQYIKQKKFCILTLYIFFIICYCCVYYGIKAGILWHIRGDMQMKNFVQSQAGFWIKCGR